MKRHYLMFDLGTGNSRVLLVTSEGVILGSRSLQNIYQRDSLYRDAQFFFCRLSGGRRWKSVSMN